MVDLPLSSWIAAGLTFVAVALGTLSLVLLWEWWRERVRKRHALKQLRDLANMGLEQSLTAGQSLFRRIESSSNPLMRQLLARFPQLQEIDLLVQQAGLGWSEQSFLLLTIGLGFAGGLAGVVSLRRPEAGLAGAFLGALLPSLYVRRRRTKRFAAFEERLPDTIDLLVRAIRAGHPLTAGLQMVAEESPEPIAGEFRRTFEEQRFGLPLDDSLVALADRVSLVDVRIMTTAIMIQRNVGGNLAEILDTIAYTIRERFKIRRQLRVYTAQGRLSGYILALLPIGVGCVLYLLNPQYIMTLFTDPAGKMTVGIAVVLQLIGFLWIRKIVNIEI